MGYVAVKGGIFAIEQSIRRLKYERLKKGTILNTKRIEGGLRSLVDQIMSESSLYSEELAAIAIKQAEGSPEEAVFLLRAYRSTLPRKHYSRTIDPAKISTERRISASFKDIPGGQILGSSYDYTHRLLDFDLVSETAESVRDWMKSFNEESNQGGDNLKDTDLGRLPKVLEYLRKKGMLENCQEDERPPDDITQKSVQFPTSRSERLQILTRGQTGAVTSLAYAALRGYGALHPTVGELRVGMLGIYVDNPFNKENHEDDSYYIGEIKVTEVETLFPSQVENEKGVKEIQFKIGYGICYGQNETKAIAMSILDRCLETGDRAYPTHNEEFVLLHIDSVESTGFISHLKLPHYVTFQSKLDRVRKAKETATEQTEQGVPANEA